MRRVPGAVDLRIQQPFDAPRLFVAVDRPRAEQIGYTQRDVAGNLLVALSGSAQTSPTYWLDPKNGVTYPVAVQAPAVRDPVLRGPRAHSGHRPGGPAARRSSATSRRSPAARELATVSHYNAQPVIDIFGGVDGTDLGSVAGPIDAPRRGRRARSSRAARASSRAARS